MKYYKLEIMKDNEIIKTFYTKSRDYKDEVKKVLKDLSLDKKDVKVFVSITETIKL